MRLAGFWVVLAVLGGGCGDSGDDAGGPDAMVAPGADAAGGGCGDPAPYLPDGWKAVDAVSTGAVSSTGGGPTTTTIDASAGGFGMSATQPWVYVKFSASGLDKVSITDVAAFESTEWDLALKRYVIRVNSGDSGPGDIRVSTVSAATLGAVTEVPAAGTFSVDDWLSSDCTVQLDMIGGPLTAIGTWYDLQDTVLSPLAFIYVVKLADGSHRKLRVVTYYGEAGMPDKSGVYQLEWDSL